MTLGIIAEIADEVAVMYKGKIVECQADFRPLSTSGNILTLKAYLACRPRLDRNSKILPTIKDFMEERQLPDGSIEIIEKASIGIATRSHQLYSDNGSRWNCPKRQCHQQPILSVRNLKVGFPAQRDIRQRSSNNITWAVNDISFDVFPWGNTRVWWANLAAVKVR